MVSRVFRCGEGLRLRECSTVGNVHNAMNRVFCVRGGPQRVGFSAVGQVRGEQGFLGVWQTMFCFP